MKLFVQKRMKTLLRTVGATFLPFELVVFGVSCPRGAETHQLSCDVSETPLQTSGALLPQITVQKQQITVFNFFILTFSFFILVVSF